jgi:hypothetical protein
MNIRVDCYSGYRGDETPRVVWIGHNRIVVGEMIDRWIAPDHRYFKFRGEDGGIYIIRHDTESLVWELAFFQSAESIPGPTAGEPRARA